MSRGRLGAAALGVAAWNAQHPPRAALLASPLDKDCENPVCASMHRSFNAFGAKHLGGESPQSQESPPLLCPIGREDLGAATWALLHTMAAYYPAQPTAADKLHMKSFIRGLAHFYPCLHCAEDFRRETQAHEPQLDSREVFMLWVCLQHNFVNAKLNKPAFPCTVAELDARWRDGDPSCFADGSERAGDSLGRGE